MKKGIVKVGKKAEQGVGVCYRFCQKKVKGFGLVEILVVIAIVGTLSSIVITSVNSTRGGSKIAALKATGDNLATQSELFLDDDPNDNGFGTYTEGDCPGAPTGNNDFFGDDKTWEFIDSMYSFSEADSTQSTCSANESSWAFAVDATNLVNEATYDYYSYCIDANGVGKILEDTNANADVIESSLCDFSSYSEYTGSSGGGESGGSGGGGGTPRSQFEGHAATLASVSATWEYYDANSGCPSSSYGQGFFGDQAAKDAMDDMLQLTGSNLDDAEYPDGVASCISDGWYDEYYGYGSDINSWVFTVDVTDMLDDGSYTYYSYCIDATGTGKFYGDIQHPNLIDWSNYACDFSTYSSSEI